MSSNLPGKVDQLTLSKTRFSSHFVGHRHSGIDFNDKVCDFDLQQSTEPNSNSHFANGTGPYEYP